MITTTSIYNTVLKYIQKGMTAIFANYWVTVAGCILLALFLSLLLARKGQGNSYFFKWETPKIYHVLHMVILILTSVGVLLYVRDGGTLTIAVSVVIIILAVYSIWKLIRYKWIGVVCADLTLIFNTVLINLYFFYKVKGAFDIIDQYNAAGMYSILAVSDLWMYYGWLMCLGCCLFIIVNGAYYGQRYFLFFPGEVEGLARCTNCGRPVFEGQDYCPYCGTKAESPVTPCPPNMRQGDARYCVRCGRFLKKGICNHCGWVGIKKTLYREAVSQLEDGFGRVVLVIGLLVICLVPILINRAGSIGKGSAEIHNAYLAKLNEYYADHTVAQDDKWREDYRMRYQDLMVKNSEWLEVPYREVMYSELFFYSIYSEAAFGQCQAIERINSLVYISASGQAIDETDFHSQLKIFDDSVTGMMEASITAMGMNGSAPLMTYFFHAVTDGIRFYLSYLPNYLFGIILILAGLASGFMLFRDVMSDSELKDEKWYLKLPVWLELSFQGSTKEKIKPTRKFLWDKIWEYVIVGCTVALILGLTFIFNRNAESLKTAEDVYMEKCSAVLLDNGTVQDIYLNDLMNTSQQISEEDANNMMETFEKHLEMDREYLAITDIPEGYADYDEDMDKMCQEDIELLTEVIENMKNGKRPSREVCSRLIHLRFDKYSHLISRYLEYYSERTKDLIFDD